MINHIMLFIVAVVFGVFGAFMGWSYGLVITIIISLTLINIGFYLYIAIKSQNLNLITYLLNKNKKEPSYAYILALKNENLAEAKKQLEKAIIKYKKTSHASTYAFVLAILNEDFQEARKHALEVKDEGLKTYNLALLDTYEGNGDQHLNTPFSKKWMNAAINTTYYLLTGDKELYAHHKLETLKRSNGIQHAANYYSFQYNEKKLIKLPEKESHTI